MYSMPTDRYSGEYTPFSNSYQVMDSYRNAAIERDKPSSSSTSPYGSSISYNSYGSPSPSNTYGSPSYQSSYGYTPPHYGGKTKRRRKSRRTKRRKY